MEPKTCQNPFLATPKKTFLIHFRIVTSDEINDNNIVSAFPVFDYRTSDLLGEEKDNVLLAKTMKTKKFVHIFVRLL